MTIPIAIKIPLKDGAYKPDYETLRKTFWLDCRHTSVTYISRMTEMFEAFTNGYATYLSKYPDPGTYAYFLEVCYSCLSDLTEGLMRLRKADHSGFKLIRGAMEFRGPFYSRADEYGFDDLGRHDDGTPGEALWSWMEKILPMSGNILGGLGGKKNYPLFDVSVFTFPTQIGGYPLGEDKFIKDGWDVPVTGVWQPISLKGGCPNFLIRGEKAPKANIPILREETPARHDSIADVDYAARVNFELGEFPAKWQLIWADDRWKNGREPIGEYEYIQGPDTELPKDPPIALRDP
jgi:Immunity protein 72